MESLEHTSSYSDNQRKIFIISERKHREPFGKFCDTYHSINYSLVKAKLSKLSLRLKRRIEVALGVVSVGVWPKYVKIIIYVMYGWPLTCSSVCRPRHTSARQQQSCLVKRRIFTHLSSIDVCSYFKQHRLAPCYGAA